MYEESKQLFSRIYEEYADQIFRFLFLKTNSREIAQDLSSETFLKTWGHVSRNQQPSTLAADASLASIGGIQNMRAFLYKTARNCLIDYYRKKRPAVSYEDALADPEMRRGIDARTFDRAPEDSMEIIRARKALSGIGDEAAEVVALRYLEDMPFSEIAEIVGKPEGTVRVIAHRGLKALRKKLIP